MINLQNTHDFIIIPPMGIENTAQFYKGPEIPPNQKPKPSFEENLTLFLKEEIDEGVHLNKPEGVSMKVWRRQMDIVQRHLRGENFKKISRDYGRPDSWVKTELMIGAKRLWESGPEELRITYLKEDIFLTRAQILKEKSRRKEETLVGELKREDLSKDKLKELVSKIGQRFFRRNRALFVLVGDLIRDSGFELESSDSRESFVGILEKEGGVVVGNYHFREDGKVRVVYFVIVTDRGGALETLEQSETLKFPRG